MKDTIKIKVEEYSWELHFKKIKRQKIVGEKGSIDMEFIRSRRRFIVDGIDVLTEIVKQAMNKDEEIPF